MLRKRHSLLPGKLGALRLNPVLLFYLIEPSRAEARHAEGEARGETVGNEGVAVRRLPTGGRRMIVLARRRCRTENLSYSRSDRTPAVRPERGEAGNMIIRVCGPPSGFGGRGVDRRYVTLGFVTGVFASRLVQSSWATSRLVDSRRLSAYGDGWHESRLMVQARTQDNAGFPFN